MIQAIHATQAFNGVMFITNLSVPKAFIRVDVLERRYADTIKASSKAASDRCGQHFELYEFGLLNALREQYAALPFPHDQLFKREAERQGFRLDDDHYRAVEAASNFWEEIEEDMI